MMEMFGRSNNPKCDGVFWDIPVKDACPKCDYIRLGISCEKCGGDIEVKNRGAGKFSTAA